MAEVTEDLYRVLGLSPDADQATIDRVYKDLIRKVHPDRAPTEAEREIRTELSARINGAASVLRDPDKRAAYDFDRRRAAERTEQARTSDARPARPSADDGARQTGTTAAPRPGRDPRSAPRRASSRTRRPAGSASDGSSPAGASRSSASSTIRTRAGTGASFAEEWVFALTAEEPVGFLALTPLGQWIALGVAALFGAAVSWSIHASIFAGVAVFAGWLFVFQPVILLIVRFVNLMEWGTTRPVSLHRTPLGSMAYLACLPVLALRRLAMRGAPVSADWPKR